MLRQQQLTSGEYLVSERWLKPRNSKMSAVFSRKMVTSPFFGEKEAVFVLEKTRGKRLVHWKLVKQPIGNQIKRPGRLNEEFGN